MRPAGGLAQSRVGTICALFAEKRFLIIMQPRVAKCLAAVLTVAAAAAGLHGETAEPICLSGNGLRVGIEQHSGGLVELRDGKAKRNLVGGEGGLEDGADLHRRRGLGVVGHP